MIYNKTSKVIISIILLSLFSLNSCSFFSEKEIKEQSSQTVSDSSSNMLKLCVTPSFGNSTQENIRSAYPDFSLINLETGKAFTAYCSGLFTESDTTGFYDTSTSQINYSITSNTFSNKEVTFYIKDSSNKKLYYAKKTISYASLGATLEPITLYFDKYIDETNPTNNTNGYINLSVSTSTGYKIICTIEGDDDSAITVGTPSTTVSITTDTDGIAPGSYKTIISVYADSDFEDSGELKTGVLPREYEIQTINVWPGLTTNCWYLPDGSTSDTYTINISEDKVKFWVKGTGAGGPYASDVNVPASYTADGSITKPYTSLNDAIAACTSNSTDYIIKVCGTVSGNSTIGSTVYANSIAIEGVSGSSVDILDGNTFGSVLKIGKAINVTLKKIQLKNGGGNTTYYGGGLYISSGANVVLENDVLITENTAVQKGGGVYIFGPNSKLTMKPGSLITKNYISATDNGYNEYGGAGVYIGANSYSDTNSPELILNGGEISEHSLAHEMRGAGVFVNKAKLIVNSGKITKNKATDIAANVMLQNDSKMTMTGGEISYGEINGTGDASAAGVWINGTTSMTMSGGKICNNTVKAASGYVGRGAGVTVWQSYSTFTMTGGEISENKVDTSNSNIIQGGAVCVYQTANCNFSGDIIIPYGVAGTEGEGLNDIWVYNNNKITITGKLTNPASSTNGIIANITPQVYSNGTPILAISSSPNPSTTLPAESVKFNIVPDVSNPNKNWGINSTGELFLPFRIIVNDSDLYLDKSSFVTAISNSSLTNQNVKIQILEMDADDFGPARTTSTVLYAVKNSPATKISLIVDEDANIKLPAISKEYFSGITNVVEMDLRGLDTSNVTSMYGMFYICNNLESLNLSSFNTSKVETMQSFLYSNKIKSLDLSSFDTSNVTNMEQMIAMCSNITCLDISNFNTSKVTNTKQMFFADGSLKTIYVSSDFVVDQVAASENMFQNCSSLTGGKGTTTSGNPINASYAKIDDPPDNPGYFTQGPVKKENLVSYITSMTENGTVFLPSNTDAAVIEDVKGALQTLYTNKPDIEVDLDLRLIRLTEIPASAFSSCGNIASIHLPSTINTFGSSAFSSCSKLKNVYVEGMKVDDWANINFANYSANPCNNGADLYLRGTKVQYALFDTATKINAYAFYGCTSIDSFELPPELKEIGNSAFAYCTNLKNIWDMTAVTTFGQSIFDCSGMNFTSLTTSVITEIPTEMFYRCNSLTSVELGSGITKLGDAAFGYCNNLVSITIPASVTSIGNNQFLYSPKDIDIYYDGTQEEWNSIVAANWNYGHNNMKKITVHFNDGTTNDTY